MSFSNRKKPNDNTIKKRRSSQLAIPLPPREFFQRLKRHFHLLDRYTPAWTPVPRFVQDWVGCANIQNTVIYTHLTSTTRTEKARSLFLKW